MSTENEKSETFMVDVPAEEEGTSITEYDITATPNDFNVLTISSYMDAGSIVIPSIQRFYTWDIKRASKFIESLILGLPVPQIFLFEEKRGRLLILDGQQRLLSIYFFIKMRFPQSGKRAQLRSIFTKHKMIPDESLQDKSLFTEFRIALPAREDGSKSPLFGQNYKGLGDLKQRIDLRPVRVVVIKQNEPKDDNSSIREIYNRLNTGGVNLRPQEMRANLYESAFYSLLYEFNKRTEWRACIDNVQEDDFMRDIELLLRSFAMLVDDNNYAPPMSRFLDKFSMKAKNTLSSDDIALLKNIFNNFLDAIKLLPSRSFFSAGSSRFSIAIFEAAFFGLCKSMWDSKNPKELTPLSSAKLSELEQNDDFKKFLQEGTTKQINVKGRLDVAKKIFAVTA